MKIIPLTKGFVAWVDDEDYPVVSRYSWSAFTSSGHTFYARTNIPRDPTKGHRRKQRSLLMHVLIMQPTDGLEVDHRIHTPEPFVIDNRRKNLRLVTRSQNVRGKRPMKKGRHSVFKGVTLDKRRAAKCWQAQILAPGRKRSIGYFREEVHAAYAYDLAAVKNFGEFAFTNFPVPGSDRWLLGSDGEAEVSG